MSPALRKGQKKLWNWEGTQSTLGNFRPGGRTGVAFVGPVSASDSAPEPASLASLMDSPGGKPGKPKPMNCREYGAVRVEGVIAEVLPGQVYRVELVTGEILTAHPAEALRVRAVRWVFGQQVTLEVISKDWSRGRIVAAGIASP